MCILGPCSYNDGLLAASFVLQLNATLIDQPKRTPAGEGLQRGKVQENSLSLLNSIPQ